MRLLGRVDANLREVIDEFALHPRAQVIVDKVIVEDKPPSDDEEETTAEEPQTGGIKPKTPQKKKGIHMIMNHEKHHEAVKALEERLKDLVRTLNTKKGR